MELDLTEDQWLLSWMCIVKMVENYERAMTFETTEEEKASNEKFCQDLKDLANKIHSVAFPTLHKLGLEGKIDLNKLMVK